MKATELRIGNLVIEKGKIKPMYSISNHNAKDYSTIKPIPLTEEWLLKFGFYKNIDTELFEKSGFQIDFSVIKCHFYLPNYGDWYKELEFVHQLQNLYFALTEEELTL